MLIYDTELEQKVCNHEHAYLSEEIDEESGFGMIYDVVCPEDTCTGLDEWEAERLFDYLSRVNY